MGLISKKVRRTVNRLVNTVVNSVSQTSVDIEKDNPFIPDGMSACARQAAAEGIVLLRNDGNILPIAKNAVISVFGRVQYDYFAVGYGSGGDVNQPYLHTLIDGLAACEDIQLNAALDNIYKDWIQKNPRDDGFWGAWPRCHEEMPVSAELAAEAAKVSELAVVVIGRSSGEDRENALEEGSYYLTETEADMLKNVCAAFDKVAVLLNCGSLMDISWSERLPETDLALLYVWQGGMESGRAIADVLTGAVCPSGRLTDTIARNYADYPASANFGKKGFNNYREDIFVGYRYFETFAEDSVLYPFGWGLSYTTFDIETVNFHCDDEIISVDVRVTNTGAVSGKEVIGVYYAAPEGHLPKAAAALAAFAKTDTLAPQTSQVLHLSFDTACMASYDDSGRTGNRFCYILESGDYHIYIGKHVRALVHAGTYSVPADSITARLSQRLAVQPASAFKRLTYVGDRHYIAYENVPIRIVSRKARVLSSLPAEIPYIGDQGYQLKDVADGSISMDTFIAQLSDMELEALCRGDYIMNSPLGAKGNAAVYGGILESLREKGVCPVTATDGPSGIRLAVTASLLPIGTALASTWNTALVAELYSLLAEEMAVKGSHVLLAPGMNIHRDPLCGRNFEYFSEDPVLTGYMGAAVVKGIQSKGVSACPKHFACNNQETDRTHNDSRVSERALREIYLKGFEICVKTAAPLNIMTSYNKINGEWAHYNYDLVTGILRGEWGYQGCVMTDWWMRADKDPDFPLLRNNAYRVRAGVDVLMPGAAPGSRSARYDKSLLESLGKPNGITRGEIQACARHTLEFVLHSYPFKNE
ncbi:MAG: glycoside hydrolase family 3 C-terminal domain-containing protein [Clostridia bacterium]|nr:glycoside hydrolase family 3 C-terminal domain-containing protein [Clostridia bacterium]